MQFRTHLSSRLAPFQFTHRDPLFTIGSCFAENMAQKLKRYKFQVLSNPFGVNYNPASVLSTISMLINKTPFSEQALIRSNTVWYSLYHDSCVHADDKNAILEIIADGRTSARAFLKESRVWLVTYGTAWVYIEKQTDEIVANCHKLPADYFIRRRLTVDEVADCTRKIIQLAKGVHPAIKLVFSVSPLRNLKDGFHENQLSKAALLLGLEKALEESREAALYFPAYEILLDDLRDYRFYKEDMLHPSSQAIDYLWSHFASRFLSAEEQQIIREIEAVLKPWHIARSTRIPIAIKVF